MDQHDQHDGDDVVVPGPYRISIEGFGSRDDEDVTSWPNTVTVEAVTGADAPAGSPQAGEQGDAAGEYVDGGGRRELVEIDTNYKPGRPGQYPVRLTRPDAARLAAAVLSATEDTFHYTRCGRLRPGDAAELLRALDAVEGALADIRQHATADLIWGTVEQQDQP